MNRKTIQWIERKAANWHRQNVSPRRLALTLALGAAVGCIPVVGIPTLICAVLALVLRLNMPAMQAANYAVMPLQLLLIVPFVRMGGRLFSSDRAVVLGSMLHAPWMALIAQVAGQALLAWLLIAIPAVALLTAMLTALLRRIPNLSATES